MLDQLVFARLIKLYPMLKDIPASANADWVDKASVMQLAAGTVVFDENQFCQGFPMLMSGSIRVIKSSPNGRELQLYRVNPGES